MNKEFKYMEITMHLMFGLTCVVNNAPPVKTLDWPAL